MGTCFGGMVFPMDMALGMGGFFAKVSEQEAHSISRRAIHLDGDQLLRRHTPDCVSLSASATKASLKVAKTLREKKNLHSASSGSCQDRVSVAVKEMRAIFASHPSPQTNFCKTANRTKHSKKLSTASSALTTQRKAAPRTLRQPTSTKYILEDFPSIWKVRSEPPDFRFRREI
ncbi:hypothetical protein PTTG_25585 [Puccinia triticina 1-1 BBBD Race 1]|uniref:Uncharacterized protein n=1 Tax=Puccinia triticina (isolate 1-1 / race 1 (BBBD)) TaxID=630390 RepID=A0A180H2H1_PUCT1|nr:hypothetical protein PTTG_25585 [Puccinia triticina 1-1 BBBD Race 1]